MPVIRAAYSAFMVPALTAAGSFVNRIGWTRWVLAGGFVALCILAGRGVSGHAPGIGEQAIVIKHDGYFPCGRTLEALEESLSWAARGDHDEVRRALIKSGSAPLLSGMRVKVIDAGWEKRKVRILTDAAGVADPFGFECWVSSEALTQ